MRACVERTIGSWPTSVLLRLGYTASMCIPPVKLRTWWPLAVGSVLPLLLCPTSEPVRPQILSRAQAPHSQRLAVPLVVVQMRLERDIV